MDELESRIAALELLAVEILADLTPARLASARDRIAEGLAGAVDAREVEIRRQALQHLGDALARHDGFTDGAAWLKPRAT